MSTSSRASELATPSATAAVLARFGLSPKKQLGQNFLVNDAIVGKIMQLAEVGASDDVLEVGPGIGTLTCALTRAARSVISVERDDDMAAVLAFTLGGAPNFQLVMRDALEVAEPDLACAAEQLVARGISCGLPVKLVANLPYAVAATVVLRFLQEMTSLASATVMVQREVAQRMQARPGTKDYGAYTVKLSLVAEPRGSFPVAPGSFLPPPRVESTVIRLDRRSVLDAHGDPANPMLLRAAAIMADAAFFARRKTIANSCGAFFRSRGEAEAAAAVPHVLAQAGIGARLRGEALATSEFIALGEALLATGALKL